MAKKRKERPEERPIWTRPDILFTGAVPVRIVSGGPDVVPGTALPAAGRKRGKPVTRASGEYYTPTQLAFLVFEIELWYPA